jgi:hypothetical protein
MDLIYPQVALRHTINDLYLVVFEHRKLTRYPTEILPLRHGLWTHVASRQHTPARIFFGGENEIMLYGGVNYRLKADPERDVYVPWAGRVVFAPQKEGEPVKMQFYQVYLVRHSCC